MSELKREMGSENLKAKFGYGEEVVQNDFDSKYPWDSMQKIEDERGNTWIRIPKFYTQYVLDSNSCIKERYISLYNIDDTWHLNPIFLNKEGKELPYVDIAAYLSYYDTVADRVYSRSGDAATRGMRYSTMKGHIDKYDDYADGFDYEIMDIWATIMLQDLYITEYANSNTSAIMAGANYNYYASRNFVNGLTDDIKSLSGTLSAISNEQGSYPMKYRGIENMIGNGHTVINGIRISNGAITVDVNGEEVQSSIVAPTYTGFVKQVKYDKNTKLCFPYVLQADEGGYCDNLNGNTGSNQIVALGRNSDTGYGLFSFSYRGTTATDSYAVYRMMRKPQ